MAVRLGRANVDALGRSLTAKQFMEWEAYARMEPFNELRADYRAASIAQMVYNMAVGVKDRKKMDEFMLKFIDEPAAPAGKQPWQQKLSIAQAICLAYGAKAKEL